MPYRNENDAQNAKREASARHAAALEAGHPSRTTTVTTLTSALASVLTLIAAYAGLSSSPRNPSQEPLPAPQVPSIAPVSVAPAPDLARPILPLGLPPSVAREISAREIESGTRTARVVVDTLFHLEPATECQVDTRTEGGACAVTVRCADRTLYDSDASRGLTCIHGLVGASGVFDRAISTMDGTPALTVTREEVTLVDNAPTQRGLLRLTYSPLASTLKA